MQEGLWEKPLVRGFGLRDADYGETPSHRHATVVPGYPHLLGRTSSCAPLCLSVGGPHDLLLANLNMPPPPSLAGD